MYVRPVVCRRRRPRRTERPRPPRGRKRRCDPGWAPSQLACACVAQCAAVGRGVGSIVAVAPSPGGCCIYCGCVALGTSHVASKMPRCMELFLYYAHRLAQGTQSTLRVPRVHPCAIKYEALRDSVRRLARGSHSPGACSPWCMRCPSCDFSTADSCLPHLRRDSVDDCTICTGTASAQPRPHLRRDCIGSSFPHLHRDCIGSSCHICTGTWLTPPAYALGLHTLTLPHLHGLNPVHICTGTG
jgi:hypothetical protein